MREAETRDRDSEGDVWTSGLHLCVSWGVIASGKSHTVSVIEMWSIWLKSGEQDHWGFESVSSFHTHQHIGEFKLWQGSNLLSQCVLQYNVPTSTHVTSTVTTDMRPQLTHWLGLNWRRYHWHHVTDSDPRTVLVTLMWPRTFDLIHYNLLVTGTFSLILF